MSPTAARVHEARSARLELEVSIDAPVEAVWRTVVERPDEWWVSDLRCVGGSTVELEPRAGGQLLEVNDEGGSLLWFTVIAVEPQRSINFSGALAPPFGGPAQAFLYIELEEHAGGTRVRMTNSLHGHVEESSLPSIESGWRLLLENGLKPVAEGRPPQ